MAEALIELRGVRAAYPGRGEPVLDGCDFVFSEGDKIGLLGPNGSGKTTLLHVMMGLLAPACGEVLFMGRRVATEKEFRQVRLQVGMLLQNADDQLFFPTVLDDVAFGPLNQGLSPSRARDAAMQTLESLGLAGFENRLTHRLSGGEKKLVSLAAVLAMQPRALLLDEPTNGLDPETRERLVGILAGLDRSSLIISHDWDFLACAARSFRSIRHGHVHVEPPAIVHAHYHRHPLGGEAHDHGDPVARSGVND